VKGTAIITVLPALWRGKLELSPSLESESSSLDNSSRMVCSDGDPLWDMLLTTASEVPPLQCWVQVVRVVDDELEEDGLVFGELDAEQEDVTGGDGGFT
jgi:hypothetical protein